MKGSPGDDTVTLLKWHPEVSASHLEEVLYVVSAIDDAGDPLKVWDDQPSSLRVGDGMVLRFPLLHLGLQESCVACCSLASHGSQSYTHRGGAQS